MMKYGQRPHWGRLVGLGLRLGVVLVTAMAVAVMARLGWAVWQTRAGLPGGEVLILPLFGLLLACGWMARGVLERHRDQHRYRGKERMRERMQQGYR